MNIDEDWYKHHGLYKHKCEEWINNNTAVQINKYGRRQQNYLIFFHMTESNVDVSFFPNCVSK